MSVFSNTILQTNPIAYWRLGEPSGLYANDEMHDLTGLYIGSAVHGAAGMVASDPGATGLASADNTGVRLPTVDIGNMPALSTWSIHYLARGEAAVDFAAVLNNQGDAFDIATFADRSIRYSVDGGAWTPSGESLAIGDVGEFVWTYDGDDLRVYRDGVLSATVGVLNGAIPSVVWFLAGWGATGSAPTSGDFQELAVWDRALTDTEVAGIYNVAQATSGFDAIAYAVADRFNALNVTPPTGMPNIRVSTADPPNQLPPLPCVLTFPPTGTWEYLPGKRDGVHQMPVRFYFNQAGPSELARDMPPLRRWLDVLNYQLRDSTQLGGLVSSAVIRSYQIGILDYANQSYTGIEFEVEFVTNEGWAAVA